MQTYIIIVQIRDVYEEEVEVNWIHLSGVDELKWIINFNTTFLILTRFFTNELINYAFN